MNEAVQKLIDEATALSDDGDDHGALERYFKALELEFNNPTVHYNIGLIFKYRGDWKDSFKYNKRAAELESANEAAWWNLGIAATALREWKAARAAWKAYGIELGEGEGEIKGDFGVAPVRLNPAGEAEVVWGLRVCPARVRIESVPYPESGVAYGDVILNDGAPEGYRLDSNGREVPVFNMLDLFETSEYSTYVVEAVADPPTIERLEKLCEKHELPMEDWQSSVRVLCRACSEGRPHDQHDHDGAAADEWDPQRRIAIAARNGNDVEAVLKEWGGEISDWGLALER
jgi:tetratricopeptide (TPR) repeat protein